MTTDYLIPKTEQFVEAIAIAIAKNRILQDAKDSIESVKVHVPDAMEQVEDILDGTFEKIWNAQGADKHRQMFREDAMAAISAINLKLLSIG